MKFHRAKNYLRYVFDSELVSRGPKNSFIVLETWFFGPNVSK